MPAKKSDINLLPKEQFNQGVVGKILNWTLTIGRYIVIITELIVVVAFLFRFSYDMQLSSLREKIDENRQIISSFQDLEIQFRYLQQRVNIAKEVLGGNLPISFVYDQIVSITPQDVYFENLRLGANSLTLDGTSLSDVGLVTLLNEIKQNPAFSNVTINSLSTKGEKNPSLNFSLKADIKKPIGKK
jgi:Tfp pilus assembly protein PilN